METISKNIEDLVAFHSVAAAGSFTKAADEMGSSKAMMSKQVRRLEAYMHCQLFQRTTRTLSLTEQGVALFNYSQKIFTLSDEASRRLKDMSQGSSGAIRISAPVSLGEIMMPSLLQELKAALPRVKIELDLSNDNRDFARDGIDFALRATESHHPDLIARFLGRIKDVVCASPALVKKIKFDDDPSSLRKNSCILHLQETAWNAWTFVAKGRDVRVEVDGSYSTNQYPMARVLGLAGLGVLRIPYYMVADDLARGRLIQLYSEYSIATHPLYLVYLRNEYSTKKHKMTKDLILKWISTNSRFFINQDSATP